ncbi:MAG: hypothetical protein AAFO99_01360 [Bacteroidota bacterium]
MHKVIYYPEEKQSCLIKAGYGQKDSNLKVCSVQGKVKEVNSMDEDVQKREAFPISIKF